MSALAAAAGAAPPLEPHTIICVSDDDDDDDDDRSRDDAESGSGTIVGALLAGVRAVVGPSVQLLRASSDDNVSASEASSSSSSSEVEVDNPRDEDFAPNASEVSSAEDGEEELNDASTTSLCGEALRGPRRTRSSHSSAPFLQIVNKLGPVDEEEDDDDDDDDDDEDDDESGAGAEWLPGGTASAGEGIQAAKRARLCEETEDDEHGAALYGSPAGSPHGAKKRRLGAGDNDGADGSEDDAEEQEDEEEEDEYDEDEDDDSDAAVVDLSSLHDDVLAEAIVHAFDFNDSSLLQARLYPGVEAARLFGHDAHNAARRSEIAQACSTNAWLLQRIGQTRTTCYLCNCTRDCIYAVKDVSAARAPGDGVLLGTAGSVCAHRFHFLSAYHRALREVEEATAEAAGELGSADFETWYDRWNSVQHMGDEVLAELDKLASIGNAHRTEAY
jgi:hypothetical protein